MTDYIFDAEWFENDDDQFLETDSYNEALASLDKASDGWGFIAHGSIQRWNGQSSGYLIADDPNDLVKQINLEMGCTVDSIYLDGDELHIDASHHDGGMTLSVKALTQEGSYYVNDNHDAGEPIDMDCLKATFENDSYSEDLPKLREMYGFDPKPVMVEQKKDALDQSQPSLKQTCEQAKQVSAALNSQSDNKPTKAQEVR